MSAARTITQGFLRSPILPAVAVVGGLLRLDRLFDSSWHLARRGQSRMLHPHEIHEAERVFGGSIPYENVRVVENSPFARRIAALSGRVHLEQKGHLAVTVFYTIHFSRRLQSDSADIPWLVHELTHVWQYCRFGPRYLTDALRAQAQSGQDAYRLDKGLAEGWDWDEFNLEQQGDVARDYYKALRDGRESDLSIYEPYVQVLRSGQVAT